MNPFSPSIVIRWQSGPISPSSQTPATWPVNPEIGAVTTFDGLVRELEDDRTIEGLTYEVYEPMSTAEMTRLTKELAIEYGVLGVAVIHSVGFVPVRECSFRLKVAGVHRQETLGFTDHFILQMKRRVPIWKQPRYAGEPVVD